MTAEARFGLKVALADAVLTIGWLRRFPEAYLPVQTKAAAIRALERFDAVAESPPPIPTLNEIAVEARQHWQAARRLAGLSRRALRNLPWAFFHPLERPSEWLVHERGLLWAYIEWVRQEQRPYRLMALVAATIQAWPSEQRRFERWLRWIRRAVFNSDAAALERLRVRCREFRLLDKDGPAVVARLALEASDSLDGVFARAGLAGPLEASGFAAVTLRLLIVEVERRLASDGIGPDSLGKLLTWFGGREPGRLRLTAHRVPIVEALLRPFMNRNPREEIHELIRAFLLAHIGDPRIHAESWAGIEPALVSVMRRWLVTLSLEDFFNLLDRTALDRHWRYRKAFWSAYLERGVISDAWMVLGPEAAAAANRDAPAAAASGLLLRGAYVQNNHSVLLMRVGDVTVAEWSHMGSCRCWLLGSEWSPRLYAASYGRAALVDGCDFKQAHHGAETGTWQRAISEFLEVHTGVRLGPTEYMPRISR